MTPTISNWRRALTVFGYTMTTTPPRAREKPSERESQRRDKEDEDDGGPHV